MVLKTAKLCPTKIYMGQHEQLKSSRFLQKLPKKLLNISKSPTILTTAKIIKV